MSFKFRIGSSSSSGRPTLSPNAFWCHQKVQTSKSSIEWEKEFDDERKDEKKNQSTFFITVQQFFEDLLEDSAFEWLENCKNKTFFFKGKKMSCLLQCSITKSRSPVLKSLFYTPLVANEESFRVHFYVFDANYIRRWKPPLILIT